MKVYKQTKQVEAKTYTNYLLELDNGILLPIEIRAIKRNGELVNKQDYAILKAIALPYESRK